MIRFFSTPRKPGWLSILPQSGQVTLAHVVRDRNSRPEVRLLDSFALEGSERDALQRLRVARQLKSYACTTLMGSEYNLTQLESPPVPAEERREAALGAQGDGELSAG
ncbi:MAG: hypothetical protein IPI89_01790 [Propionivibrio sp.]|nr:hypothetical protein [Propionivibrio sp.]